MMRKIIIALAIVVLAVPAWGAVTITCTPYSVPCLQKKAEVIVSYSSSAEDPNLVRAFALDVKVDSGAHILRASGTSAKFNIYPGSIDINDATGAIDDYGSVVCDSSVYLVDTLAGPFDHLTGPNTPPKADSNGMTIEMASLYVGAANAPGNSGELFRFMVDKACNVTITENAIRGGVLLEDGRAPGISSAGCAVPAFPARLAFTHFYQGDLAGSPLAPGVPFFGNNSMPDGKVDGYDQTRIGVNWNKNQAGGLTPDGDPAGSPLAPGVPFFGCNGLPDDYCDGYDQTIIGTNWRKGDTLPW